MNEVEREAQVTSQLVVLNTYVDGAAEALGLLHSRLDGVLQPQTLQGKETTSSVEQTLVPVASKIRDIRYKVEEMINLTQSIIGRLEL